MTKTVSLETAKLLKEAGWPQGKENEWHWIPYRVDGVERPKCEKVWEPQPNYLAAPDTTELLEALPSSVYVPYYEDDILKERKEIQKLMGWTDEEVTNATGWLSLDKQDGGGWIAGYGDDGSWIFGDFEAETPAEVLAKLWLELREQKII